MEKIKKKYIYGNHINEWRKDHVTYQRELSFSYSFWISFHIGLEWAIDKFYDEQ